MASIALRSSDRHPDLLVRLVWPIRRLAAEESFKSDGLSESLALVHALLLLCIWPLPYASLVDDPSWTFIGIAVQKGSQIGLNGTRSIAWREKPLTDETARSLQSTWLVCTTLYNLLSFRFSTHNVLSVESSLIERHLHGSSDLPPIIIAAACISQKDMAISSLFSQDTPMTTQIVKLFESDLDGIKKRFEHDWDLLLDNNLSGVKLRLYSMFLSRSNNASHAAGEASQSQSQRGLSGEVATYVSKAYQTALDIIQASLSSAKAAEETRAMRTASVASNETQSATVHHWTVIELQYFTFATFILFDLSQKYQPSGDTSESKTMVHRAWDLLNSCSVIEGDHYRRICDVIQYLVTRERSSNEPSRDSGLEQVQGVQIPLAVLDRAQARYSESWKRYPSRFPETFDNLNTKPGRKDVDPAGHGNEVPTWYQTAPDPGAAVDMMPPEFDPGNEAQLSELIAGWNFLPWDFFGTDTMDHGPDYTDPVL
jgi:hypothetical protein